MSIYSIVMIGKKLFISVCMCIIFTGAYGQEKIVVNDDSTSVLSEVTVYGYLSERKIKEVPASISVLTSKQIALQSGVSLVSAMNTMAGVRMEERTPGSYRLSLRGSTLRSPYGVRNVKVYLDEIPLTGAGGNTYLNALDISGIRTVEVMKGPDGSLFGANSGGVVLLNPMSRNRSDNSAEIKFDAGSYGLIHQSAKMHQNIGKNELEISQAYQRYNGYRDHSSMDRFYFQIADRFHYGEDNKLKLLGFYSNLNYQTPGGLTLEQFNNNPRSSRPATATLPGAIEQQIGVRTKIFFGGLVNEVRISKAIRNVTSIFGSHVDFENPFITNFEQRDELTYGVRTYFEYSRPVKGDFKLTAIIGAEWQQTQAKIDNYDNLNGKTGNPQAFDELSTNQYFIFGRYAVTLFEKLNIEAGASLNNYHYRFRNLYPLNEQNRNKRNFTPQFMPRLAASYSLKENFIWRVTLSRGYSTPTIAEVRPGNNVINTGLDPETGWNLETGFRLFDNNNRIRIDASVFYYRLENSIVNRRLADDTDYFLNAGGTNQSGLELDVSATIIKKRTKGFIRGIELSEVLTISRFRFRDYIVNGNDYSGNNLTGTPLHVSVVGLHIMFPARLYLYMQCNFTGRIPLNDGNTVFASSYELLQAKIGWQISIAKSSIHIYAGADNILNQKYSLGNDLNAFGNRFYNPAPARNIYAGLQFRI